MYLLFKVHTPAHLAPVATPSMVENKLTDLHSCRDCKQYFKSRKGYLGHLTNKNECPAHAQDERKLPSGERTLPNDAAPSSESLMNSILDEKDYSRQRELEEKLVKDIIAKVKRECEEKGEGEGMMMRKGYTKKMRK